MRLRERIAKLERRRPKEPVRCWLSEDGVMAESQGERLPISEIEKLPGENIVVIVDYGDDGDAT